MNAVIYIDPAAIQPVIDGEGHRTRLTGIPGPGQNVTMLCGLTAAATFEPLDRRHTHGAPTQCAHCDLRYRREHGIPPQQDRLRR
jgi:hypothetical protein